MGDKGAHASLRREAQGILWALSGQGLSSINSSHHFLSLFIAKYSEALKGGGRLYCLYLEV